MLSFFSGRRLVTFQDASLVILEKIVHNKDRKSLTCRTYKNVTNLWRIVP